MIISLAEAPLTRQLALGGERGRPMRLDVVDHGVFIMATQRVRHAPERPGQLHVEAYEYVVCSGESARDWAVRWEYDELRSARLTDPHPAAHFHVNAAPTGRDFYGTDLPSVHFATQKMLLEQVLLCVCSDIVVPRLRAKSKDTKPALLAVMALEEELARIGGREA